MKFLKTAVLLSVLASMAVLSGCTACDSSSVSSSSAPSSSMSSTIESMEESLMPSTPSSSAESGSAGSSMAPESNTSSLVPTLSTDFSEIGALDGAQVTWGPGRQMDANNRPVACVGLQEKYGKYNCYFIGQEKGKLYLTFDEGYENGYTAKMLDVLKEKKVQAVFFVTMHYVKTNPELIQRMIDEGHVLGNHSDKHPNYTTLPLDAVQNDLMSLHNYIRDTYHYNMSLFRYPEGAFSEQTAALIGKTGYRQLFWSFAYSDWDPAKQPEPAAAKKRIMDAAHDGAIYLLHAVSDTNYKILGECIDELRAKGFEFSLFNEVSPTAEITPIS